jgi:hypothetical protein
MVRQLQYPGIVAAGAGGGETRITIYAPMIYTAPCIMFWMRAHPFRGEVGGGWALEFSSFLGPVKWHRADRRVPFGAQKTRVFKDNNSLRSHKDPDPDLMNPDSLEMLDPDPYPDPDSMNPDP